MQPSPLFLSEWYSPFPPYLRLSSSTAPCTPPGVRGGSAVPVPAGHTHTCSHADKATGAANEAELFLRCARPLLSVPVRGRHDTIVVASPHQDNRFLEGEEPVLVRRGIFFFHLPCRCGVEMLAECRENSR